MPGCRKWSDAKLARRAARIKGRQIPDEVLERATWYFSRQPFDWTYTVWYPKAEFARCTAWDLTLKSNKEFEVSVEKNYVGWRKMHTKNYWCWYAYDRE